MLRKLIIIIIIFSLYLFPSLFDRVFVFSFSTEQQQYAVPDGGQGVEEKHEAAELDIFLSKLWKQGNRHGFVRACL